MNNSRLTVPALVALCALACVPASVAKATGVSFQGSPGRVFEGQRTTLRAFVSPANASCHLAIKYKGGHLQRLATKSAVRGRLFWSVRVPAVPAGPAMATVSCARAGTATAWLNVQWAVQAPKVRIARSGFSQRLRFGGNSDVSYGLEVQNERTRSDATNVSLLVNMVDDTNRVLGTGYVRIQRLPASSVFYVGGQTLIPTQTRVSRLEVVVNATSEQKVAATPLLISDLIVAPSTFEPYVDSVRGQLLNRNRVQMDSGVIGAVVEDASGNIIGGGMGYANGPLSYGAREAFSVGGSFNAIPIENAAQAVVSVIPNYHQSF